MQLLRGRTTSVDALAISPDGRYVVAGGPGACDAWDLRDPKASPRVLDRSDARTHKLTFASDTTLIAFREFPRGGVTDWWWYDLGSGAGVELACPMLPIPERVIVHPSGRLLKAGPHQRGPITTLRLDGGGREWVTVNHTKHDYNWLLAFNTSGDRYVAREYHYRDTHSKYRLRDTATDAAVANSGTSTSARAFSSASRVAGSIEAA